MLINALLYSYDLTQHEYGPSHPFKPARVRLMSELLNRYGLISEENQRIIAPLLMNEELLYLLGYIELLKKGEKGEFSVEMLHAGLGTEDNPPGYPCKPVSLRVNSRPFDSVCTLNGAVAQARGSWQDQATVR